MLDTPFKHDRDGIAHTSARHALSSSYLAAAARRFFALGAPGSTERDFAANSSLLDAMEIFFRFPITCIWSSFVCRDKRKWSQLGLTTVFREALRELGAAPQVKSQTTSGQSVCRCGTGVSTPPQTDALRGMRQRRKCTSKWGSQESCFLVIWERLGAGRRRRTEQHQYTDWTVIRASCSTMLELSSILYVPAWHKGQALCRYSELTASHKYCTVEGYTSHPAC